MKRKKNKHGKFRVFSDYYLVYETNSIAQARRKAKSLNHGEIWMYIAKIKAYVLFERYIHKHLIYKNPMFSA